MARIPDHEYYLIREADERAAAAAAVNPDAKAIHLQLAELYAAKAADAQAMTEDRTFLESRIRKG
ncbi:MAG: hypothetical protein JWR77_664 [Rhizorhabdus sp.]|nr:hypothetical protein [Rhizorhabdus sp.]